MSMARFFSDGVYFVGGGVSVPRLISVRQPEYTAEALAARIEGPVELSVTIGQDGIPRDIGIKKGLGYGLDEKAIECVGAWRFSPGVYEGNPVPVAATLQVNFRVEPVKPPEPGRRFITIGGRRFR